MSQPRVVLPVAQMTKKKHDQTSNLFQSQTARKLPKLPCHGWYFFLFTPVIIDLRTLQDLGPFETSKFILWRILPQLSFVKCTRRTGLLKYISRDEIVPISLIEKIKARPFSRRKSFIQTKQYNSGWNLCCWLFLFVQNPHLVGWISTKSSHLVDDFCL